MSTLLLLPNLGGEESGDWRHALGKPRVAAAARAWRFLFSDSARVAEGAAIDWDAWPKMLAPGRNRPAFDWLDGAAGCVAWLGDRRAHAAAAAAGHTIEGPPGEIIERVHDKAFALRAAEEAGLVPRALHGTSHVFEPNELSDPDRVSQAMKACIESWPEWTRRRFTLKPRRGTSGRGRLAGNNGEIDPDRLSAALPRFRARGGAILEPWLDRASDLSVQLRVEADGRIVVLGSLQQLVSASGTWLGHRGEVDSRGRVFSGHPDEEALREAGALIGNAAAAAGFFGPAGLDALTFRLSEEPDEQAGQAERIVLRSVVEWNARFTMGTVTIGLIRRVLPTVRRELALGPGERRAFLFAVDAPQGGWPKALEIVGRDLLFVPLWCDDEPVQPALLFADNAARLDRLPGYSSTVITKEVPAKIGGDPSSTTPKTMR
jgi:hypothetical protein